MALHDVFSRLFGRVVRIGAVQIGARLVMPVFRTAGFFYNEFLGAKGLSPRERLRLGATLGFPANINPFIFAFLTGTAYESREELNEGWLSLFGEILFKDFPDVEGNLETGIKAGSIRDFRGVMDAIAESFVQETGLDDAAAFFRGLGAAASDFRAITGVAVPFNWIGSGIIWLDRAIRGIFDPLPMPDPPGEMRPPDVLEPKTERELPGAIKRLTSEILREEPKPGALFKIGRVTKKARAKLRRLILGGGGT